MPNSNSSTKCVNLHNFPDRHHIFFFSTPFFFFVRCIWIFIRFFFFLRVILMFAKHLHCHSSKTICGLSDFNLHFDAILKATHIKIVFLFLLFLCIVIITMPKYDLMISRTSQAFYVQFSIWFPDQNNISMRVHAACIKTFNGKSLSNG